MSCSSCVSPLSGISKITYLKVSDFASKIAQIDLKIDTFYYLEMDTTKALEGRLKEGTIKLESQFFADLLFLLRERYGVEFIDGPTIRIKNERPISIPDANYVQEGIELIQEREPESSNKYAIDAIAKRGDEEVRIYISCSASMNLVLARQIEGNLPYPVLVRHLPDFGTMAASYDFAHYPNLREALLRVAHNKVPAQMLKGLGRTKVTGTITPNGIDAMIGMFFQEPNAERALKCYEVEISQVPTSDPVLGRLVPSSIYQPREQHFCMTGDSYPLIPVDLNEVIKLKVLLNAIEKYWHNDPIYRSISSAGLVKVAGEFPLSVDGTNQWYVANTTKRSRLALMGAPDWNGNLWLVLNEGYNSIRPEQVYRRVTEFLNASSRMAKKLDSLRH